MATLPLADQVRAYALEEFIIPGLREGTTVAVRAGDVHAGLGLRDRAGAVCRALWAHLFQDRHGLRLISTAGPPEGLNTTFVFADAEAESRLGRGPELAQVHVDALAWYRARARQVVPWASLQEAEPYKAVLPKRIYRPAGWRHALSVKIMPSGPDELPDIVTPGVVFRYHQEEAGAADPSTERSNLGLANCMRDRTPIGIVRQVRGGVSAQYEVLGVGRVLAWADGFFSIEILDQDSGLFEEPPPLSNEDARRRVMRAIVARRGQARFRQALLAAYDRRCAISDCDVEAVLEAAHIVPYLGDHTDVLTNGLLLRADLHTLFDLGRLRIKPETRSVVLEDALLHSEYREFHKKQLREPRELAERPSTEALMQAWRGISAEEGPKLP